MPHIYPFGPKSDWEEQAQDIVNGKIATTEQDIPMLLEWLQDTNWPGALQIAAFLPKFGSALLPHVKAICHQHETTWTQRVLEALLEHMNDKQFFVDLSPSLLPVVEKMDANSATGEALCIIKKFGLQQNEYLQDKISEFRRRYPDDDYYLERFEEF